MDKGGGAVLLFPDGGLVAEASLDKAQGELEQALSLPEFIEGIDFGIKLTGRAKEFLANVLEPIWGELLSLPSGMKEFTVREVFQLLMAAEIFQIPSELPAREEVLWDTVIFRDQQSEPSRQTGEEQQSAEEDSIDSFPDQRRTRDQIAQSLANVFVLRQILERYRARWAVRDDRQLARFIREEVGRTRRDVAAASYTASFLQIKGAAHAKRADLERGARTLRALDEAREIAEMYRVAQERVAQMREKAESMSRPEVAQVSTPVSLPIRVTCEAVIDLSSLNVDGDCARFQALVARQIHTPALVPLLAKSLQARDWRTLKYPALDKAQENSTPVDPLTALHEIARRSGEDAHKGANRAGGEEAHTKNPEEIMYDLIHMVFDEGRPLLSAIRKPREMRVSDVQRVSAGPLQGKGTATVDVITGYKPWLPN